MPPSVVVFLIALPLSMGIARASGMPAMLGLITAVVGGITVGFLGGAPLQISGPSAGLIVLVLQWVGTYRSEEDPYGITSIAVIVMIAGLLQAAAAFSGSEPIFARSPRQSSAGCWPGLGSS